MLTNLLLRAVLHSKKLKLCSLFIVLSTLLSIAGCGKSPAEPAVVIDNVFMKVLPPGQTTAAAYMKVTNHSKVSQSITYIHSPVAEHIEIHRNFYEDGMMQMRPVKRLTVNPGETKVFAPGGFHLMVFGVYDTFSVGDSFEITFEFDSGIVKTERLTVRPHG